jgi:hypothetical protein
MGSIKGEVHTDVLVDVRHQAGKKEKIGNEGNKGKKGERVTESSRIRRLPENR